MMICSDLLRAEIERSSKIADEIGGPLDRYTMSVIKTAIEITETEQALRNRVAGIRSKWSRRRSKQAKEQQLADSAWGKGWQAGVANKPASTCPYKHNKICAEAWHKAHGKALEIYHGGPAQ